MIRESVSAWPLSWPSGWPRTPGDQRRASAFMPTTFFHQFQEVLDELRLLGVRPHEVVVSSSLRVKPDGIPYSKQGRVEDPGVAVWFVLAGAERVLACDRLLKPEHNLRAIALHVSALRGQERWGVGSASQAFAGFVALPEQATGVSWWDYFSLDPKYATEADVRSVYRESAKMDHPDAGGDRARWDELQSMLRIALDAVRARGPR